MAESGSRTAGQNGSHQLTGARQLRSSDRVDPAPRHEQTTALDAALDHLVAHSKREKLVAGDHPVLLPSDFPDLASRRLLNRPPHMWVDSANAVFRPGR
jgi:hypothetical protein